MTISWPTFHSQCKTHLPGLARSLLFCRERWKDRAISLRQELENTRTELARANSANSKLEADNQRLRERIAQLENQAVQRTQEKGVELPPDPPAPGQQFGPRMIQLAINLGREIGIRPCLRALKTVFRWLKIDIRLPSKDAIRCWMQRLGVARIEKVGKLKDAVWFVDETVQIGKEKVLAVVAADKKKFHKRKRPITQKDLVVLAFRPATSWSQEHVLPLYQELTERHGMPRGIVTDGGKNLREPIEALKNKGKSPLGLRDVKHLLANALESVVGESDEFKEYASMIHQTISSVQQTELAHFAPPSFNRRSRFMNLKKHLDWFRMILWQWEHPDSKARKNVSVERMKEKLGWVAKYKSAVKSWTECQEVIAACLKFTNRNGLYRGSADDLLKIAGPLAKGSRSRAILDKLITYMRENETKLIKGECLPISTEILESSFSSYKRLERHQSRGGFTTLLPVFATLLKPATAKEIEAAFQRVKVKDVQSWVKQNIPSTLTSRRQEAFRESRSKNRATLFAATG